MSTPFVSLFTPESAGFSGMARDVRGPLELFPSGDGVLVTQFGAQQWMHGVVLVFDVLDGDAETSRGRIAIRDRGREIP